MPPMPENEADRLATLALYQALDTPPEFAHDALTELAAEICRCPIALVSLIDERRQWFKSKHGLPADSRRFAYDVWGNSVNLAQRLEEACAPGRVNLSGSTLHQVSGLFETTPRGRIEVKHTSALDMHVLDRIKPEFSADPEGCVPNHRFWTASGLA